MITQFLVLGKKLIRDPSDFLNRYSVTSGTKSANEFGLDDEFGSLLDEDAVDGFEDADAMMFSEDHRDSKRSPGRYQYS